jgi:UDP-2-acetamido-3-amino-2,3-dideoxy-glucuronate N-acetyltransferase
MVWDQARVREGAVIGEDCIIGRGAYVDAGVHIGSRVKIQNNALVYHGCNVEDDVFIGPAAVLTNDRNPRAVTVDGTLASADDWLVSQIRLSVGCSVGANAVVVAGCDIGAHALVGAGAVVTRSVPDYAIVVGNPARILGWACECGSRLVDEAGDPIGPEHAGAATCNLHMASFDVRDGQCRKVVPA